MALSSIDDALKRIRRGEMVLVVDDEDRENEGDLTMAASWVTGGGGQLHAALGPRARLHAVRRSAARHARRVADGAVRPGRVRHRVRGVDRPRHRREWDRGRPIVHARFAR